MKKIFSASNSPEAHLVAEALRQEDIRASVRGESGSLESPSVWIDDDSDSPRASALIAEMMPNRVPDATRQPTRPRSDGLVGGIVIGALIGLFVGAVIGSEFGKRPGRTAPPEWDSNGDGRVDTWARYDRGGRLVNLSEDRDFDGKPDGWYSYDPSGVINTARYDLDHDGREDYWVSYQKGLPASYTADNDRNGTPDEWGRFENGHVVERNWSFANDRVADRRAIYRDSRKVREEYDRNRDGVFDETLEYDEFERVTSRR